MSLLDDLAGAAPTPELRDRRLQRVAAVFARELAPLLAVESPEYPSAEQIRSRLEAAAAIVSGSDIEPELRPAAFLHAFLLVEP